MAKSKIIKDLISEKISLSQVLDRMIVIAMELEDEALLQWVKREKEGYFPHPYRTEQGRRRRVPLPPRAKDPDPCRKFRSS